MAVEPFKVMRGKIILAICVLTGNYASAQTVVDYFVDYSGGTNGSLLDTNSLLLSTHGPTNSGTWRVTQASGAAWFCTTNYKSLSSVSVNNYGTFPGTVTQSLAFSMSNKYSVQFTPTNISANGGSSMSAGTWWYTDILTNNSVNIDTWLIYGPLSPYSTYMNVYLLYGSNNLYCFDTEIKLNNTGTPGSGWKTSSFAPKQWYWLTHGYNVTYGGTSSNYLFALFDSNTNLLSVVGATNVYQIYSPLNVTYGMFTTNNASTISNTYFFSGMVIDTSTAKFPLMPGSPPPSGIGGVMLIGNANTKVGSGATAK
jgi:hypothetical protein